MRCHKPGTDQSCDLVVHINGAKIEEYILPSQLSFPNEQSDILECFVPISPGDIITLRGSFSGTVLHGSFDLLADGTYVGDKRIEGAKSGDLKCWTKRPLNFEKVLNVPKRPEDIGRYDPRTVVEGSLVAKELPKGDELFEAVLRRVSANGTKLGLGSIAVRICINQKVEDMHEEKYADKHVGFWRYRKNKNATSGGISPTHEVEVQKDKEPVNGNRQSKHHRHFEQLKFGKQPWATFIFYYRDRMAIHGADCELRPDVSQSLVEYEGEEWLQVEPAPRKKRKAGEPSTEDALQSVEEQSLEDVPSQPKKKKLFGQPLFSEKPAEAAPKTPAPQVQSPGNMIMDGPLTADDDSMISPPRREEESLFVTGYSSDPEPEDSLSGPAPPVTPPQRTTTNDLQQHEGDVVDAFASGSAVPDFRTGGDAPTAGVEPTTPDHEAENAEPSSTRVSSPPPIVRVRGQISHEEIRALADRDGRLSFADLVRYCDGRGVPQPVGIMKIQQIATKSGPTWWLNRPFPVAGGPVGPLQRRRFVEAESPLGDDEKMDTAAVRSSFPRPAPAGPVPTAARSPPPTETAVPRVAPPDVASTGAVVGSSLLASRETTPSGRTKSTTLQANEARLAALKAAHAEKLRKKREEERKRQEEEEQRKFEEAERVRNEEIEREIAKYEALMREQ